MRAVQVGLLQLLLIVVATNGTPTTTSPPEVKVPHEPRGQPPHPPLHGAVADKAVQPIAPRDTQVTSNSCTDDSNCTAIMGSDAICFGSFCSCNAQSSLSPTSQICLRESSLGSGCSEDWQCTRPLGSNVECKGHICTCTQGAVVVNGKCWKQKLLSDKCSSNEECIGVHDSVCEDQQCVCKPGLVPKSSNDKCLIEAKNMNDPCEEDIQCTEAFGSGGTCSSGKCACQTGYHFKNHKCMKNLILGDLCGTGVDGDCYLIHDFGLNNVLCKDGKCQCRDDLTATSDNQKCLGQGQTDPGSGGGAESVQPLMITFVTIFFVRLLSS